MVGRNWNVLPPYCLCVIIYVVMAGTFLADAFTQLLHRQTPQKSEWDLIIQQDS